jgi:septation ring formation regulator EzrA
MMEEYKKYIVIGVIVIVVIFIGVKIFNKKEINNEVLNENIIIDEKEAVLPEGFMDENLDFDYNLVLVDELYEAK